MSELTGWYDSPEPNVLRTYVATGDSNTDNGHVSKPYPVLLQNNDSEYFKSVINSGQGGADTFRIRQRFDDYVEPFSPDIVSFMFGTNDHRIQVETGLVRDTLTQFRANYRNVIDRALLMDAKVVLMTPPFVADHEVDTSPGLNNARLCDYVAIVHELISEYRTGWVDVHAFTTALCGGDQARWRAEFTLDGTHLTNDTHVLVYHLLRGVLLPQVAQGVTVINRMPNILVLRQACDDDPGLQIEVSDSGLAMFGGVAKGNPMMCWPVNSVLTTTTNVNPSTAMGFGTWTLLGSAGGLYSWERAA